MYHILVVDDEARIRAVVKEYAQMAGFEVSEAVDGNEAIAKARSLNPDLIILDIMMPGVDGFAACRAIRAFSRVPIIMLSARGEEYDKLLGFELGIDDYVEKPFSPKVLLARAQVIIQRSREQPVQPAEGTLTFGGLVIDMPGRTVCVDGERVEMTPKEYELLFYMVRNQGVALSRERIMREVWGYTFAVDDRTVDAHIKMLRRSLGPYRDMIVTLRAMGYKFEAENTQP
nr:response regulator transcription factor [bacterium]